MKSLKEQLALNESKTLNLTNADKEYLLNALIEYYWNEEVSDSSKDYIKNLYNKIFVTSDIKDDNHVFGNGDVTKTTKL